jgi:hypothetical protein
LQVGASIEATIGDAVREAVRPMGLTVTQQMQTLERTFVQLSNELPEHALHMSRERGAVAASNEASTSIKALEGKVAEGFDRLDQNVGAAFSAYSGVLKLAVAALDRTDLSANHVPERTAEFALRGAEKARR